MTNKEELKTWCVDLNKTICFIDNAMSDIDIWNSLGNIRYYQKAFPDYDIKFVVKNNVPLIEICGICPSRGTKEVLISVKAL